MNNNPSGGDDLRDAASRLRSEAETIADQLDEGASAHIDSVTPELKQTMDDISGAVADIADKAKGFLSSLTGKLEEAAAGASGAANDASGSARAAYGDARDVSDGAASTLERGAEAGASAARDAAAKGSEWLEETIGMSPDELLRRAKAMGGDLADSVRDTVEGVERTGEQARRATDETLN